MDCNNCTFEGRLTKDAVYSKTSSGKSKLTFCLAVNSAKNITDYLDFEVWEGRADGLSNYLEKGKMVCVIAQARYQKWTDKKSGETKSRVVFVVRDVLMHGGGSTASTNPADEYVTRAAAEAKQQEQKVLPTTHFDEYVPFGPSEDEIEHPNKYASPAPENFDDDIPF